MKKILILVNNTGKKKQLLVSQLRSYLGQNVDISLASFSDVTVEIDGNKVTIEVSNQDISNFNLIYFRRAGNYFMSLAGTLAVYMTQAKINYFDTTFAQIGPAGDKLTSLVRLALAGLPVMHSYFCSRNKIYEQFNIIVSKLGFPLISKELASHCGYGVFLLKNKKQLSFLKNADPKDEFLFQKYYPNDEDYRLLVLKNKIAVFERKIRDINEFRSNVYLGAKEEFIDPKKVPDYMRKVAIKAANTLNIEIAGVDILIEKGSKKIWLLEVNRGPGFTYNTKVSPEMRELSYFFTQELKSHEE